MKTSTTILLLISLVTVFSTITDAYYGKQNTISHLSQNKYHYPRTPQSCTSDQTNSSISEVFGWYWDNQVCQPCDHIYCKCSASNGCRSCKDGFKLLQNVKGSNWSTCVKCPTLGKTSGKVSDTKKLYAFNDKIHNQYVEANHLQWPEVKECEIFEKLSQSEKWFQSKSDSGYDSKFQNHSLWDKALRSVECGDDRKDQGILYQHYGSICWYIIGCEQYTKWGKCSVCLPGWFKTDNQYCTKCRNTVGEYNDYKYDFGTTVTDQKLNKGCAVCSTEHQCTQCAEGYYLVSPYLYQSFKLKQKNYESKDFNRLQGTDELIKNVLDDASWCAPCPTGCSCDEPFFSKDKVHFKSVKSLTGYYKKSEELCIQCNASENGDTAKYCTECSYINQQFKCTKCQEYITEATGIFNIRYTLYFDSQCLLCPENCRECEVLNNNKNNISCKEEKCFNGYRQKIGTNNVITCVKCTNEGVARCKTGSNSETEIPTQCLTGKDTTGSYDDTTFMGQEPHPKMSFTPPNVDDYYLVGRESQKTLKCIKNVNLCKTMNEDSTCKTCYNNYIINTSGKCVTISNCERTDSSGCTKCAAGYNLKSGACTACTNNTMGSDCTTCVVGYRKNTANNCEQCNIQNCSACDKDRKDCEKCKPGYVLWRGKVDSVQNQNIVCEACEYGCITCEERKVCTVCAETYYLHAGTCHQKLDNCAEWDGKTNKCGICNYGYRMTLIGEDRFCLECFAPENGVIHCPTSCQGSQCYYSTVNNDNLDNSKPSDDDKEEPEQEEEATA